MENKIKSLVNLKKLLLRAIISIMASNTGFATNDIVQCLNSIIYDLEQKPDDCF